MKSSTLQTLHSSATPEHGTPPEIVEAARLVLCGIDLDPASSEVFNEVVRADKIYTKEDDGLSREWEGTVFLNPPSGDNGRLVKKFWSKLAESYFYEKIRAAIWVGFSIDQLQTLQGTGWASPMQFPICVPRRRLQFSTMVEESTQQGLFGTEPSSRPVKGESPTKPNFICYLPPLGGNKERFAEHFGKFGAVRL